MSDLVREAKYLRYYYSSEDALKDKDILKNQTFATYQSRVQTLFLIPLGFQVWQLLLVNQFEQAALYNKVRILKAITFTAAFVLGVREKLNLEQQWTYYNRFYPEPTELQKSLTRDAEMFKLLQIQPKSLEEKSVLDSETVQIYEQLYRLPPQTTPEPEEDVNPASIKPHY